MRSLPTPIVAASTRKWLRALRPLGKAPASSNAPTSRSGAVDCAKGRPFTSARPEVGASSPTKQRMVVDLPEPLGPRKPVTMPGRSANVTSSSASTWP